MTNVLRSAQVPPERLACLLSGTKSLRIALGGASPAQAGLCTMNRHLCFAERRHHVCQSSSDAISAFKE